MHNTDVRDEIPLFLKELAASYIQHFNMCDSILARLSRQLRLKEPITLHEQLRGQSVSRAGLPTRRPTVDTTTFCVVYEGRRCFLANTLPFKLFKVLGERLNRYVSHDDLLSLVWRKPKLSNEAIRNVVQILKKKLIHAEMSKLAGAIDGRNPGHYGLILNRRN